MIQQAMQDGIQQVHECIGYKPSTTAEKIGQALESGNYKEAIEVTQEATVDNTNAAFDTIVENVAPVQDTVANFSQGSKYNKFAVSVMSFFMIITLGVGCYTI